MKTFKHPETIKTIDEIKKLRDENLNLHIPAGFLVQGIISSRLYNGMTTKEILDWVLSKSVPKRNGSNNVK